MGQKVGNITTKVIAEGLIYNMDPANRSSFDRRGGFPPYGSSTPLPNGILKNTVSNPGHISPNGTLSGSIDYTLRRYQPRFINNVYNYFTQTTPTPFSGLVEVYGGNDFGILEYDTSYAGLGMVGQDQDEYLNNQKLTLSGWCKWGGASGGNAISTVFGYRGNSIGGELTNRGVGLYRLGTNNTLIFQLGDENTSNVGNQDGDWSYSNSRKTNAFPLPTVSPTTYTWVYIAGTWDGVSAKIYINGFLANTATPPSTLTIDYSTVVNSGIGGNGVGTNRWQGQIGPVQIYNRALTPNEVLHNFNALKGRFDLT